MSSLIFIISSYLPNFGSVYCSFSNSLGDRLGCLFEIFFFFCVCGSFVSLWTSLLKLLLLHLQVSVWLHLHCHLFWSNFKISSLISLLTQWSFSSMLFSLYAVVFFSFLFLWLMFYFYAVVVRKDAWNNFCSIQFAEACFVP